MVEGIVLVGESCTVGSRLVDVLHRFLELSLRCGVIAFILRSHRSVDVMIQSLHHGLHVHSLSVRGRGGLLDVVLILRSRTAPEESTETDESSLAEFAEDDNHYGDEQDWDAKGEGVPGSKQPSLGPI